MSLLTDEQGLKLPADSDWVVKQTAEEVAQLATTIIINTARQAIRERGVFTLVLAGGTTPKKVYQLLAKEHCDWQHWHIYLGDERCLPIDDTERNSQMIEEFFLQAVNIPAENIHFIAAEKDPQEAATSYAKEIEKALPFDLVMLGMGEDGHTASLFPTHQYNSEEWVHAVSNAPKPPAERVSLSYQALSQNHVLLILITGASKNHSVLEWKRGVKLPVTQVKTRGTAYILLDSAAWSR